MTSAAQRWAEALEAWSVPAHIIEAAPASPWGFDPAVFASAADEALARAADSPSDAAARAALPIGGTLLDVGAGAGAASLRLHGTAGRVIAVDPSGPLLDAFRERAQQLGVPHEGVVGSWPDAAADVPVADVVTCHHVVYNVPSLSGFAAALAIRAGHRIVLEMTAEHPMRWTAPLWEALHGLDRPSGPTAGDAVDVLRAVGWDPRVERWERSYDPLGEHDHHAALKRIARRLCVPAGRHEELRQLLDEHPPPTARTVVTIVQDIG